MRNKIWWWCHENCFPLLVVVMTLGLAINTYSKGAAVREMPVTSFGDRYYLSQRELAWRAADGKYVPKDGTVVADVAVWLQLISAMELLNELSEVTGENTLRLQTSLNLSGLDPERMTHARSMFDFAPTQTPGVVVATPKAWVVERLKRPRNET